jgi:enterobactin synthetase component D
MFSPYANGQASAVEAPIDLPSGSVTGLLKADWRHMRDLDGSSIPIRVLKYQIAEFDPCAFAAAGICCPPRISRSVHKRQAEFFFGRLAARDALTAFRVQLASASVAIGPSREPVWPAGIVGSITHDHDYAAAVVQQEGRERGIGIDIARVIDEAVLPSLLDAIVDRQEFQVLRAQGRDWPGNALLTLAFSAKESLFKATYRAVGYIFDFDAARVTALEPVSGRLRLTLTRTLCGDLVAGKEFELGFEFLDPVSLITHLAW